MTAGSRPLVPSRLAPPGVGHRHIGGDAPVRGAGTAVPTRSMPSVLAAYVALTKPRIIELLLITTVPTMVLARGGWPATWLVIVTVVGGTLAAAGANAVNMVLDRDIDRLMKRTQGRPLVTGAVTPGAALLFAAALELAAFVVLWWGANLLSAVLALAAAAFYIGVYTVWLKRTSRQNIVIGGAAGAVPVLVGWAAVRDGLDWAPIVLFAAMFLWTPPHFWALAIKYRDEYQEAGVPMLPAVVPLRDAARQMAAYTVALVVATLILTPVASLAWIYTVSAAALGAAFIGLTVTLVRRPTPAASMRVFTYSITYVTLLFAAIVIDVFVEHGVS